MKKITLAAIALVAMVAMFTGCRAPEDNTTGSGGTAGTTAPTTQGTTAPSKGMDPRTPHMPRF